MNEERKLFDFGRQKDQTVKQLKETIDLLQKQLEESIYYNQNLLQEVQDKMDEISNLQNHIQALENQTPAGENSELMQSVMTILQQNQNFTTKEHVENLI